jgi:hypothetical protein
MSRFVALSRSKAAIVARCSARTLSSRSSPADWAGPIPHDLEHYTAGWNIKDISDYTAPGTYVCSSENIEYEMGSVR